MEVMILTYSACFDGASKGNPGAAGAGAAIYAENGDPLWEMARYLGRKTNNEAEYTALILLLEEIDRRGLNGVRITGDSKLVVNQVNRKWKVTKPHLKELFDRVLVLLARTGASVDWVPRERNAHADALSNKAFEKKDGQSGEKTIFDPTKLEKVTEDIFIAHGTEDYAVDLKHGNCSCPAFRLKKDCKHLKAAMSLRPHGAEGCADNRRTE